MWYNLQMSKDYSTIKRECQWKIADNCIISGYWKDRHNHCGACKHVRNKQTGQWKKYSKKRSQNTMKWISRNRDRFNRVKTERLNRDPMHRITANLRIRVSKALKGKIKAFHIKEVMGCSLEYFKKQLEESWTEGMNWTNYGIGTGKWNIDHIIPCASFNMNLVEDQELCFHHSNCRAMWHIENVRKGCR